MEENVFEECHKITALIAEDNEAKARDDLIKLLEYHERHELSYAPVVNHLIRETGLYPYMQMENSSWQDRFVHEAFKVNNGEEEVTLHREQSLLLKAILDGENIAVSAPTSFGKSFIVDAYIAINRPQNVVIVVPTIALMDETRRRLYKKFSEKYKIITTTDASISENNIFIFPQERALSYLDEIKSIDLLVIDEFYKASMKFDKERSSSLIRTLIGLGKISKQKYFLAPNIKTIKENSFTRDMRFIELLDFNTVYLEKHETYKILEKGNEKQKSDALLEILSATNEKTLIYAGTYTNIDKLSNLINTSLPIEENSLLQSFSEWLSENYSFNWSLTNLVKRGTGVHNGRLHRSLSQIQVKLFEEPNGLNNIISTSSIIEGVNTSAQNVVIWHNRNGGSPLNDFTYKNIIGRGGRMFKHFIGQIHLLEEPPKEELTQLEIPLPENLLADVDENSFDDTTSKESIKSIIQTKSELRDMLGVSFDKLLRENVFQTSNTELIKTIAKDMIENPTEWNGLSYLNSEQCENWDRLIYKVIRLSPAGWEIQYNKFVSFVKVLSQNWELSIPELLDDLEDIDIDVDTFFKLEKNVTYKLSTLLSDVNELQKILLDGSTDISAFISKTAHAFLPTPVFQLEEYGLPRMITKKIHEADIIDFENKELDLYLAISALQRVGKTKILALSSINTFDAYIVRHFYDGITKNLRSENNNAASN